MLPRRSQKRKKSMGHSKGSNGDRPVITLEQHILQGQQRFPGASGEFSWLLSGITLATKLIQAKVRRAGLTELLGSEESTNVQGEVQQKLDVYSNRVLLDCLTQRESIAVLGSEEIDKPLIIRRNSPDARYVVYFDPLDGSSNIDVNVSVGTIFSIMRAPERWVTVEDVLQRGHQQVAAGYVVYGSSTILVYSVGSGVHGFTLDPSVGDYLLSHADLKMPEQGKYYSVNEAYRDDMPANYQEYLDRLRSGEMGRKYGSRYIGSLVADFHRTLLKGGVFFYPPTLSRPDGKLRLMYEANPIAFLAEQAGGRALDGQQRILDVIPTAVHQRTPLVVGGVSEVEAFENCGVGAASDE